jgi:hypothetical protein
MKFWYSITFSLIFAIGSKQCDGQTLHGIVVDSAQKTPLGFVSIKFVHSNISSVSDSKGNFKLILTKAQLLHDSIEFKVVGYQPDTIPCLKLTNNMVVQLAINSHALKAVTVKSRKSSVDSLQLRSDFKEVFEFRKYKVIEAFSLTSINVDKLYASLSKKNINKKKLRQILLNDEKRNYIDSRFNRRAITQVANINDYDLPNFMNIYRPSYQTLSKFSDYDLLVYIKKCLKEYSNTNQPY